MTVTTTPTTTEPDAAPAWESPSPSALTWLVAGAAFLLAGALLLLLVAAQAVSPNLLTIGPATSVGRLRPAAYLLVVYGGLGMLGAGVALDVTRRIAKAAIQLDVLAKVAGAIVTAGVVLSAGAVLTGHSTGRVGFEMPWPLAVLIALGEVLVLGAVVRTAAKRTTDEVHPALWFVVAALVCAPFVLLAGALPRVHGVNDELVLAYGLNGLKMLWLVPLGMGVALYAVPAASRAALYSRQLAGIAFWGWFLFAPFAGPVRLVSGPAQNWVESVGVAATVALGIPVLAFVTLVFATYARRTSLAHETGLRFALAGTGLLALWAVMASATAGRTAGAFLHGTPFPDGLAELALLGVAASFLLAGAFHGLPGIAGAHHLANPRVASAAVWLIGIGAAVVGLSLLAAGYVQGAVETQAIRDGVPLGIGATYAHVTDAIRPLLWLRVMGDGLAAVGLALAFQQVFSTSTAGEPIEESA